MYCLAKRLDALPDEGDEFSVSDSEAVTLWDSGEEMEKEKLGEEELLQEEEWIDLGAGCCGGANEDPLGLTGWFPGGLGACQEA